MVTGSDETVWLAAGLYDPSAPDAEERRDLLEYLASEGVTVEEMAVADRDGTLEFVASDRIRGMAGPRLTVDEIATRAGLDASFVRRVARSASLPDPGDEPMFALDDVALFQVAAEGAALFGEARLLEFTRVLGEAVSRIAEVANSVFARGGAAGAPQPASGGALTPAGRAREAAVAMRSLMHAVPLTVVPLLRHHFQGTIARYRYDRLEADGDAIPLAVGFVDLVQSTELLLRSDEMPAAQQAFVRAADAIVVARQGRVVKTIGDAVMFVCLDARSGADAALAMLEIVAADQRLAGARAGLSFGHVAHREADYFGPVVNLAARLVGEAPAGSLLVDAGTAEWLSGAEFVTTDAGAFTPKGFDALVALRSVTRR